MASTVKQDNLVGFAEEFLSPESCWLADVSDRSVVLRSVVDPGDWRRVVVQHKPVMLESDVKSDVESDPKYKPDWTELWWGHDGKLFVFPYRLIYLASKREEVRQMIGLASMYVLADGVIGKSGLLFHFFNVVDRFRGFEVDDFRSKFLYINLLGKSRAAIYHMEEGSYYDGLSDLVASADLMVFGFLYEFEKWEKAIVGLERTSRLL